jgi:hypothetical protein
MRQIKLLNKEPPCLVGEPQQGQVNVQMLLISQKNARSSKRDLFRQVKSLHYATGKKDQRTGFTVVLKKILIFYCI